MYWLGEEGFEFGSRLVQGGGDGPPADGQVFGDLVVRQLIEKTKATYRTFALGQLGDGLAEPVGQLPAHGVGFGIAVRAKEAEAIQPDWATKGRFSLPQTIQGTEGCQAAQQGRPAAYAHPHTLDFHEDVLDHVLGVRSLAQDAPGGGEDHRPMLAHDPFPISGLHDAPVPGIGHRLFLPSLLRPTALYRSLSP